MRTFKVHLQLEGQIRYFTVTPGPGETHYDLLRKEIINVIGTGRRFKIFWRDGTLDKVGDLVVCTSQKDLEHAMNHGADVSSVQTHPRKRDVIVLYVQTVSRKGQEQVQPRCGWDSADNKPSTGHHGAIRIIDPSGTGMRMGFNSFDKISFLKQVYGPARGIPVELLTAKYEDHGKSFNDKQTVRSVENHGRYVHVSWPPCLESANIPVKLKVVDQHGRMDAFDMHTQATFDWQMRLYHWKKKTPRAHFASSVGTARESSPVTLPPGSSWRMVIRLTCLKHKVVAEK